MSNTEWRPKVGERVRFEGALEADDMDNNPFMVRSDCGGHVWFREGMLSPLPSAPEPRKPWEVLREAVALLNEIGGHTDAACDLDFLAAKLEAAAAPKLPTLAEAVRAWKGKHLDHLPEHVWSKESKAIAEALARAENGA